MGERRRAAEKIEATDTPRAASDGHAVVIAGGGPTGLMLAAELALAGIDVAIVERRATQALAGARAGGLAARTLEILDQRGIVDRFLAEGQKAQVTGFGATRLDLGDFPTRHNYGLAVWQNHIERILAGRVDELGVPIYRECEIEGFEQDDRGVDLRLLNVRLGEERRLRAEYLVGCDGGRSVVRKAAGIDFPGWEAIASNLIAEVEVTEMPPMGIHRTEAGVHSFGRIEYEIKNGEVIFKDVGPVRVMVPEARVGSKAEPNLEDLREALQAVCGTDFGVHNPTWISRFTDASRQAATYRAGRVLLAGDAAHVHSPIGGQGLNTGVQDAFNLGWKLAQVVRGISPESLLDTYHAERHPVGARVLRLTMAQVALHRTDERTGALREVLAPILLLDEPRRRLAAELSGLGIRYDLGEGHPLLGCRMPDLDLVTPEGPARVFTLLHPAQPVFLDLALRTGGPESEESLGFNLSPWADRVRYVAAEHVGSWELPALGEVAAPSAVLIRPDGVVAWVGERAWEGLGEALTAWFGPPRAIGGPSPHSIEVRMRR